MYIIIYHKSDIMAIDTQSDKNILFSRYIEQKMSCNNCYSGKRNLLIII
jgi:hypothetical protein